jgi:hypothetical protein
MTRERNGKKERGWNEREARDNSDSDSTFSY